MAEFPLAPDFPVEVRPKYKTLVSTSEAGYTQRRRKWQSKLREFPLTFSAMTEAEKDLLEAFFDTQNGAAGSFTFDNPVSTGTLNCRFKDDVLSIKKVTANTWTATCVLEEVK